ncbi:MAG: hypothetical protein LQ344_004642 [Seirophora lacunosa]|nr:MAG: hypothetical protein LQ344_004642 [Seirophora lacunosa]
MEEDDTFTDITFTLEEDLNRKDQLFSFRKDPPTAPTKDYHAKEQQLLQEGKLGSSEFSARLRKVIFGTFDDDSACLILFRVDFASSKKGWFRFRNATVEAEFEPQIEEAADDDDDDDNEEEDYTGPLIRKFYPELIRGHISSAAETYGLGFEVPLSPMGGAAISAGYKITSPREGLHLIHGRLMGSPETRVKWTMNENEVSKGGIYEQPMFAVIVRHAQDQPFTMALKLKATTYGGLPVVGKGGSRILFRPPNSPQATTGSIEVGGHRNRTSSRTEGEATDLATVDLEALTQMKAILLSEQGPGGGGPQMMPLIEDM